LNPLQEIKKTAEFCEHRSVELGHLREISDKPAFWERL